MYKLNDQDFSARIEKVVKELSNIRPKNLIDTETIRSAISEQFSGVVPVGSPDVVRKRLKSSGGW